MTSLLRSGFARIKNGNELQNHSEGVYPFMTNEEIFKTALKQSAYDCNCKPEDFLAEKNIVTISKKHDLARKYLPLPFECDMVSYGSNIVAQTSERLTDTVTKYISKYPVGHCFDMPNLHVLDEMLYEYGLKVCFLAEYFLL